MITVVQGSLVLAHDWSPVGTTSLDWINVFIVSKGNAMNQKPRPARPPDNRVMWNDEGEGKAGSDESNNELEDEEVGVFVCCDDISSVKILERHTLDR